MKKRISTYIAVFLAFLLLAGVFAAADGGWYVNDALNRLPQFFDGVYAIGDSGTSLLSGSNIYALSADGLQLLGAANSTGGGGLRYDDHRVSIRSDRISVGLYYYYSAARDSSLSSVTLQNVVGTGFSFGYEDPNGNYVDLGTTQARQITVRAGENDSVLVFDGDETPAAMLAETGRSTYLLVRPCVESDEAVTSLAQKRYYGDFAFAVLGNGKLTVVNQVELERYVMGVCAIEMSESWPVEALKAQAVAARTYAQKMIRNSVYYYSCGFDLTADTYCQAYSGCENVGNNIETAVRGTENCYLTYQDTLADALYSAADGGATESNVNVFGNQDHPYLVGIIDPYEASATANPYRRWTVTMTPTQLGAKMGIGPVREVVPFLSDTGNVIKLVLISESGATATIIRDSCRTVLGLRNIHYTISQDAAGNFVFTGSGYGHNLGMSQWGAYAMAKNFEKDFKDILGFYYTGVGLSYGEITE